MPARHANVIKKHKHVVKEKTFLPEPENNKDKDKATKEALAILNKEYEIFNDPEMLPTSALPRYDTWDQDRSVEEWLEYCRMRPDQAHALSPVYHDKEYTWKPVKVLDYDFKTKRYVVMVCSTGATKRVTRLSLLFYAEDPEKLKERVNLCKNRQRNVEAEERFTNCVDNVPSDAVSMLSEERRANFLDKCMRDQDKYTADFLYKTFTNLMRVVQEEYTRQMKKCIVMKQMHHPMNFGKFEKMKIPVRLNKRTYPYLGVEDCETYNFLEYQGEILRIHWCSDEDMSAMTRIFSKKCIDFQSQYYMNTNKVQLKLPRELSEIKKAQESHHNAVTQNMLIQWHDFLVGEMQEKLKKNHHFFESNEESYQRSQLKRIILRFEFILNSYLRDFVKQSITDWVEFIKSFTLPKYELGELWARSTTPFLQISLAIRKPLKDAKKKSKKRAEDGEEEDTDDQFLIQYSPSLPECNTFMRNQLLTMVKSTNDFKNLEKDLMPFLTNITSKPNFELTPEFPWVADALTKIDEMFQENTIEPEALLKEYKKYEYVLNVKKKKLVNDLFENFIKAQEDEDAPVEKGKAPYEEIHKMITEYHIAEYEILNISNDNIDFTMFRVLAQKIKSELYNQCHAIKTKLLEAVDQWCKDSVNHIQTTYSDMGEKIKNPPQNEKELVEIREFIKKSKEVTQQELTDILKQVERHYEMLDEFSWHFNENDIRNCMMLKSWPMVIGEIITDGNHTIVQKEEQFQNTLDSEKEDFKRELVEFETRFDKIVLFNSIDQVGDFVKLSHNLNTDIEKAKNKVQEFNERERLFGLTPTEYQKLDDLETKFKPFCDLLDTAFAVNQGL